MASTGHCKQGKQGGGEVQCDRWTGSFCRDGFVLDSTTRRQQHNERPACVYTDGPVKVTDIVCAGGDEKGFFLLFGREVLKSLGESVS